MKTVTKFLATVIIASLVACSSDDNNNNGSGGFDLGIINLTVTGEVEGDFSGMADFDHLAVMGTEIWSIDGNDYSPQTFSISFTDMAIGGTADRPTPGTYSIGSSVGDADYSAIFLYFPDGFKEYSTTIFSDIIDGGENSGTLTITSSNENTVKGHFEFTAYREDDDLNIAGTIQVQGEFTANKRMN